MDTTAGTVVKVTTSDGYILHGNYCAATGGKTAVLHMHGSGGNFYGNDFYADIAKTVNEAGISYLATNNHGSGVYEFEVGTPLSGISLEVFENCLLDIDAWIEFLLARGATSIILEGHSFGTGKVTYYMAKGKYKDTVKAVIYLGTNGVFQTQQQYLAKKGVPPEVYLAEADKFMAMGKPTAILADPTALCGYYPASAGTYINFFRVASEMFKSTMMATKEDGGYRHLIAVPLLWILGDDPQKEYLFVPFEEAFNLIRSENPQVAIHQLKQCDHGLHGHEAEAAALVSDFLKHI